MTCELVKLFVCLHSRICIAHAQYVSDGLTAVQLRHASVWRHTSATWHFAFDAIFSSCDSKPTLLGVNCSAKTGI